MTEHTVSKRDSKAVKYTDFTSKEFSELMDYLEEPRSRQEIQEFCGLKSRDHLRNKVLVPLINVKKIDLTIPEKPQSSKQKYVRHSD